MSADLPTLAPSQAMPLGTEQLRLAALVDHLRALPAETGWVEFKVNNIEPDRIARTVCALANTACLDEQPFGYLLWGVQDETHEVVGTAFEPTVEKKGNEPFELWLAKSLSPSPSFRFKVVKRADLRVVLLEIPAASTVPVKFNGIPYLRVGSATPKLSDFPEREADLVSKLRPFVWEHGAARSFVTGEEVLALLDHSVLFTMLKQQTPDNSETILERLAEERLIARDVGGRWNILNLGAILLARRLDQFDDLARKALRVVQYDGKIRAKSKRIQEGTKGYAAGFVGLLRYIDDLLPSEERIEQSGVRVQRRTFPQIALRELAANALVHQDMTVTGSGPLVEIFDNRVEISNPGAPVTDVLRKLFGAPPRSRNEQMARLMRRMGLCEELGSGLVKIVAALEEYRLPGLELKVVDANFRATLFGVRPFAEMSRIERARICYQHACLKFHEGGLLTNASLRDRFGIEDRNAAQVSRVIRDTLDEGGIRPADPERPKAGYVPYWA